MQVDWNIEYLFATIMHQQKRQEIYDNSILYLCSHYKSTMVCLPIVPLPSCVPYSLPTCLSCLHCLSPSICVSFELGMHVTMAITIIVCIYIMAIRHSYTKIYNLSQGHRKFAIDKPPGLQAQRPRGSSVANFR